MSTTHTLTVIPVGTWAVDPVHSNLGFRVVDTSEMISTITGRFTDFEGTFEGGDEPGVARAYGTIRAASITTDQEQRDAHLRSPDFFDVEKFPEIRFESDAIEPLGGDRVQIRGRLIIKGVEQDVELEGRLVTGTSTKGEERLVFDSQGGYSWGPMNVDITASISAVKSK
jgi:polyisoprenoid-binding protein YceI